MSERAPMTIRSFHLAFALERRLFKVDRWRLPVPYGVPLRSIAYAAVVLVAVLLVARLPLAGALVGSLPAPLRLVVLPAASSYALTRVRIDGRPAHRAICALWRAELSPRRLVAFRPSDSASRVTLAEVAFWPDEHCAGYRRAVVDGPASVLLRYPVRVRARGRKLQLRARSRTPMWRGKQIRLRAGQRAELV